jgi:hypothetical protein
MDVPWAQAGWSHLDCFTSNAFEDHSPLLGDGFALIDLPPPLGRTGLGICMDLNPISPPPFTPTTIPYEFADFALENCCKTLVLLCNWLDPGTGSEIEWSVDTINYWARRLFPLWDDSGIPDSSASASNEGDDSVLVVICNRTGVELGQHMDIWLYFKPCRSEHATCRYHVRRHLARHEHEPFVRSSRNTGCNDEEGNRSSCLACRTRATNRS